MFNIAFWPMQPFTRSVHAVHDRCTYQPLNLHCRPRLPQLCSTLHYGHTMSYYTRPSSSNTSMQDMSSYVGVAGTPIIDTCSVFGLTPHELRYLQVTQNYYITIVSRRH